ncbi:phospholipase D-like domain-containing protein, partial [Stenotrophomonas maltophilia]
ADLQAEVKAGRWKEYLSVMNLRSYGVLADVNHKNHYTPHTIGADQATPLYVVTEQCYVHSKLLIVDDAVAIIGSANCNDRSLLGTGDTEIAAVIVDGAAKSMDLGNGLQVITRKFARDLRMKLWRKFLGEEIEDVPGKLQGYTAVEGNPNHPPFRKKSSLVDVGKPASGATWKKVQGIAEFNASLYQRVFPNVPRDAMSRYDAVFSGFPSAGLVDDGNKVGRMLYAQPSDLSPEFMREVSEVVNARTLKVGRHNVEKVMSFLGPSNLEGGLKGFWVAMPLMWGHGMDDPAALMPTEIIANVRVPAGPASGTLMASRQDGNDEGHQA